MILSIGYWLDFKMWVLHSKCTGFPGSGFKCT